jgi:hypothetical protein
MCKKDHFKLPPTCRLTPVEELRLPGGIVAKLTVTFQWPRQSANLSAIEGLGMGAISQRRAIPSVQQAADLPSA